MILIQEPTAVLEPAAEALLVTILARLSPGLIPLIRERELASLESRCERLAMLGVIPSDLRKL